MFRFWFRGFQSGLLWVFCCCLLHACGTAINELPPSQTVVVHSGFQTQLSPVPTPPVYRCGAWTSQSVPSTASTLIIYARLTRDIKGIHDVQAQAVVHFKSGDVQLQPAQKSDTGGYVSFSLPLQGRQPAMAPATVDVLFSVPGQRSPIKCSTFFTPQ